MKRRNVLLAASAAATWPLARAQAYPAALIRMIVPYAAGGGLDAVARVLAQGMGELLGRQIVVDNRTGAGGTIGASAVAKAAPDGYTVLMGGNPELTIAPAIVPKLPYVTATDFTPVMLVAQSPNVLVTSPALGASTLARVLELGRSKSVQLSIGTPGNGSPQHIACEALKAASGVDIVHVPFRGAGPATLAALSGEVKLALVGAPPALPHIRAGKLLALAVTQQTRSALVPDVPTVTEATGHLKGQDFLTWYGLLLPARTPATAVAALEKAAATVLGRPEIRERLATLGTDVQATSAMHFAQRMRAEATQYAELVARYKVTAD